MVGAIHPQGRQTNHIRQDRTDDLCCESPVHEQPINFDNIQSDARTGAICSQGRQTNQIRLDGADDLCCELPLREKRRKMLLSKMVGYFKMNSAKKINDIRQSSGCPVWQRNYFERIIRDENELQRIQEYILQNPLNWGQDEENPDLK